MVNFVKLAELHIMSVFIIDFTAIALPYAAIGFFAAIPGGGRKLSAPICSFNFWVHLGGAICQ